jgi:hypothetical protein
MTDKWILPLQIAIGIALAHGVERLFHLLITGN